MEEGFTFRLNDLFEELVAGKYHEVIDEAEKILQNDKTDVETRIEAMLAKSWSLYYLAEFEFREEYTEKALETISEAFLKSSEVRNTLLMFETIYIKYWTYCQNFEHKKAVECIETAKEIYNNLKGEFPEVSREYKTFLLSLNEMKLNHNEFVIENYKWIVDESICYLEEAWKLSLEYKTKGSIPNKLLTWILLTQFFVG